MFVNAIKKVSTYTRPIYFVDRTYLDNKLSNGSATMFFVNEEGYALTCKHVAMAFFESITMNKNYLEFKEEIKKEGKLIVEDKFGYKRGKVIQRIVNYPSSVLDSQSITYIMHPKYDLAIIKFNDFKSINYQGYAIFKKDESSIKQGMSTCKLGFPFPEFENFEYDENNDQIIFNKLGKISTPIFPLEGMITRFVRDEERVFAIETSTPGLKGQSGGPLFDIDGLVIGMQSMTKHIHLGFDVENTLIKTSNGLKSVSNYPFLNLGQSIHSRIIKEFLNDNNVKFYEE